MGWWESVHALFPSGGGGESKRRPPAHAAPAAAATAADRTPPPNACLARNLGLRRETVCTTATLKGTPSYSASLRCRLRWQRVLRRAATPEGGAWAPSFDPAAMTAPKITKLADLIDQELLEGAMRDLTTSAGGAPLRFEVEDGPPQGATTASYFRGTNAIVFYRSAWRPEPSLAQPVQIDGIYTLSRLEWLAHTVGHELVHAIIENCCSPSARRDAARGCGDGGSSEYNNNAGHGPPFGRLSRHLLGHTGTHRCLSGWRRDGRRYVVTAPKPPAAAAAATRGGDRRQV